MSEQQVAIPPDEEASPVAVSFEAQMMQRISQLEEALAAVASGMVDQHLSLRGLHAKIAEVQAEIGGLGADKTARIQSNKANYSYEYLTEGAIMATIRRLLSSKGVATYVSCDGEEQRGNMTVVHVRIHFVDGPTGERMYVNARGYGTDPADKGYTKALTSAVRVGLSKTFLQSGDIDPEDHYVERERDAGPRPIDEVNRSAPADGLPTRSPELINAQRGAATKLMERVHGDVGAAREIVETLTDKSSIRELVMDQLTDIEAFLRWQGEQGDVDITIVEQAADWKVRFGDLPY